MNIYLGVTTTHTLIFVAPYLKKEVVSGEGQLGETRDMAHTLTIFSYVVIKKLSSFCKVLLVNHHVVYMLFTFSLL